MTSRIPTSTSVVESMVINAHLSDVWHLIKLPSFGQWWSKLSKSAAVNNTSPETDVVRWDFVDGTVLEVKQEEHSSIDHFITYSVITATPELSYSSVVSTIRCFPVTCGDHKDSTFVQWTGNFSSDADAGVLEDAKFKRREGLADLATAAKNLKK